jgi:methionyl-tRNA synthetase
MPEEDQSITHEVEVVEETPRITSIPFDQFAGVELRVGTIEHVEPVEGSEKLYRLLVNFGEAAPRQILSGIAKHVAVEDLLGQQRVFVTNIPPRPMMGMESHGMILAADSPEGGLALVAPTMPVPPGSRLH